MTGPPQQLLVGEVIAEAEREAASLVEGARQDGLRLRAEAAREADALAARQLEQGRLEAERRRALILATVPLQANRLVQLRIEGMLAEVAEQVRQRLLTLDRAARTDVTIRLAADAMQRLGDDGVVVKLAPEELALDRARLRDAIAAAGGRDASRISVVVAPELSGPGPWVESADGHRVWDNRLLERLTRLWPALRSQVAARLPVGPGREGVP